MYYRFAVAVVGFSCTHKFDLYQQNIETMLVMLLALSTQRGKTKMIINAYAHTHKQITYTQTLTSTRMYACTHTFIAFANESELVLCAQTTNIFALYYAIQALV